MPSLKKTRLFTLSQRALQNLSLFEIATLIRSQYCRVEESSPHSTRKVFNVTNAMGHSSALLPTSVQPPRPPTENMSNLGHDVYSGPQVVENVARKRIFAAEGSEDDALIRLQNSKKQRTPLPTDRLEYAGMNIIVKTESFFAMAAQDPRYAVPIPYVNRIQSVSNLVPTLSMSGFEQTPNNQINPEFSKKAFNDVPASVNLNSHSFDPNSAIKSVFKPAPTFQATQQNILGYGNMPWDTILFTKRAAIANLAKLGRSIKGAVKGRSGKLEILKVTQELAYAECTRVDVKQYMLTTPVDARAIRRIWPE